jgi:hypothetical protein
MGSTTLTTLHNQLAEQGHRGRPLVPAGGREISSNT